MTSAFHLFMPFKNRNRFSAAIAVATLAGLLGWSFFLTELDLPKAVEIGVLGILLAVLQGREALPLLNPGFEARSGLTIDAAGLTLARGDKAAHWCWDEISNLKLRSPIHPARLIFGRFISFRAPADARRKTANNPVQRLFIFGRSVVIGDDFPSQTEEIFRQIEHYRDMPTGNAAPTTAKASPPEPLWSSRNDRKQPKLLRLSGIVLAPFIGIVVAMALLGNIPDSIGELLDSWLIIGMTIGLGAMLPWIILVQYRWESKQDNMLAVSAGGLATRQKLVRRLWLWRDIIDIRVQQSVSRGEDGVTAEIISFRATHDGSEPGKKPKEGKPLVPVSCSIEGFYETPIEEIARQSRAWWDWSTDTFGKPVTAIADAASWIDGTIAFRRMAGYVKGRSSPLDFVLSFAFIVPMIAYGGVMIWMAKAGIHLGLPSWLDQFDSFLFPIVPLIGYLSLLSPGLNRLELTETGLLSVCYGRKRRWSWPALGAAELRRVRSKWSARPRSMIVLDAPANGWGSAFLRWAFNIDNRRQAVIEDIYDTSLDEIAEALNDRWRRQAGRVP